MREEVLRVLKMVEEGKITSEKASELIEALNKSVEPKEVSKINFSDEKMLKVKVLSGEEDKVNIQLPVNFIKAVIGSCKKVPLNIEGMENVDVDMLLSAIDNGLTGKIVDVKSSKGDIVEIVIE
ncbi:hypothetical protein KQI89_08580 [Clostridium sp. MSJ-4]|uniref:YvlB/LiaX N-terminal domain-containing protein n=1 Tax=Clostridium simiarum TaxID=2841506 RepID=A0ABS6F0A9_9CLOT|nr:hypothetical protein [Clostridium simiarum]MBU5591820.1 hypothetical protein [Clostridium simiarum]